MIEMRGVMAMKVGEEDPRSLFACGKSCQNIPGGQPGPALDGC